MTVAYSERRASSLHTLSPSLCDLHASGNEDDGMAPTRWVGRDFDLRPLFPLPPPVDLDLSPPPLLLHLLQLLLLLLVLLPLVCQCVIY